jgi:hypothetical protein
MMSRGDSKNWPFLGKRIAMRKSQISIVACVLVLAFGGIWVLAQEKQQQQAAEQSKKAQQAVQQAADAEKSNQPQMTAEQMAMMQAMVKAGTPGPQHEQLKMLAGKFDADVTMQMDPSAPPMTSKGTENNEMLFDGRYLKQDFAGEMMGQPFKGMGITGFDNQKQKFFMTWIDSMSTMIMMADGSADDSGKVITFKGECECPGTKEKMQMRQVVTIQDKDHHTYESYQTKDGKEAKVMEIKYTRTGPSAGVEIKGTNATLKVRG